MVVDVVAAANHMHIFLLPCYKGIMDKEIVDKIAKSIIRLATEPLYEMER